MNSQPRKLITFVFDNIIDELIGEQGVVPISPEIATSILLVTQNKPEFNIYVQDPHDPDNVNLYNKPISCWKLWRLHWWRTSTEAWLKSKRRQDREREDRFIFDANVRMITKCILRTAYMSPELATILAVKELRANNIRKLNALGVKKLFTTMKELP